MNCRRIFINHFSFQEEPVRIYLHLHILLSSLDSIHFKVSSVLNSSFFISRYQSNSAPSTTLAANSKPPTPTIIPSPLPRFHIVNISPLEPLPASPTPASPVPSSMSASDFKPNRMAPHACTAGRSTAFENCPRMKVCLQGCTGAKR